MPVMNRSDNVNLETNLACITNLNQTLNSKLGSTILK